MTHALRYPLLLLLVAAIYFACGVLTFSIHSAIGLETLLWAPGGFAFAVVLLFGLRWWPGVALGLFTLMLSRRVPLPVAVLITAIDVVQVIVGAVLLVAVLRFRTELDRLRDVLAFISVCITLSMFAATANVAVLATSGLVEHQSITPLWRHWWWANLCGDLIVTPAILTCVSRTRRPGSLSWKSLELVALALAGSALVVIAIWTPDWIPATPYYLVPMLAWAGIRFGPRGAALATFGATATAVTMYAAGLGLFAQLVDLQSFVAISTLTTLTLSAVVLERERAIERRGKVQIAALDAIIMVDHAGKVVEINPAAETMFDVRTSEVIGRDAADLFVPPRLRESFRTTFHKYTATDQAAATGCRYRTTAWRASDGVELDVEVAVTPLAFEDRINYTAFVRDISSELTAERVLRHAHDALEREVALRTSELQAANLALEQSGTLMRQAEELARMGSFEFDVDTRVLKWSDELYRIYGRDPVSFTPTYEAFMAAIHPADRASVSAAIEDAVRHIKPFTVLEHIVLPDGTQRALQTLARVTLDARGHVRIVGCCEDVTAREAFAHVQSRLVQLVESSQDAIIGLTPDGIIETWNAAATRMFGYTADEAIGASFTLIVPSENEPKLRALFEAVRAGEHFSHYELEHCRKDHMPFPASVTMSAVMDPKGNVTGISKVIRDITKQKRVDTQLRSSLREKEVLLREIHHRVKNNLQVIASLLNIQMTSDPDAHASKGLIESQNRIQSMALVHQLLYQSKDLADIDFGEYLSKLARRLAETYDVGPDRIAIEVVAPPLRLDVDHAIPCGLIVNELVTNAITHAFPPGRRGFIRISIQPSEQRVLVTVEDNGIGIPRNIDLEHAHTFGLRIARTLTQQLDGTITLSRAHGTKAQLSFAPQYT